MYLGTIDILDPKREEIKKVEDFFTDPLPFKLSEVRVMSFTESKELIFVTASSLFFYSDSFHEVPLKGLDVTNLRGIERSPNGNFWLTYYMLFSNPSKVKIVNPQGDLLDSIAFEQSVYLDIYEWDSLGQAHFYVYYHRPIDTEPWQDYYLFKEGGKVAVDSLAEMRFASLKFKNNFIRRFFSKVGDLYWVYSKNEQVMVVPEDLAREATNLREISKELKNPSGIYEDREGAVWITTSFGIYRYTQDDQRFHRHFYSANGIDTYAFRGIKVTGKGPSKRLWAMSEMPRNLLSENLVTGEVRVEASLKGGKLSLSFDKDSSLLYMNDLGLKRQNAAKPNLNRLFPLAVSVSGSAWVIHQDKYQKYRFNNYSTASLFNLEGDSLTHFPRWHGSKENLNVYQVYENESDTAWLVTSGGIFSLNLKNGDILERYWAQGKGRYRLESDNVQHLLPNKDGSFWLATAKNGLLNWSPEGGVTKHFGRLEGLPSNNVYAVYHDQRSNLWLATEYGISLLDGKKNVITNYNQKDGLSTNEFNRISHFQDKEGIIYFGGLNGITSFQPADFYVEQITYEPNLIVTAVEVYKAQGDSLFNYNYEAQQGERIEIHPGDYFIQISVALLGYGQQEKVQYAYLVKGLDKEWTYQASNTLRLGKLPYGDFQLQIVGQQSGGRWSGKEVNINISVLKPFYLKSGFIVGVVLIIAVTMAWFVNLRGRKQLAKQKELEKLVLERTQTIEEQKEDLLSLDRMKSRFFANISHELRTPLTLINTPLKKLINEGEGLNSKEKRWLTYMRRNVDILMRLVNEILDLSKLEGGKLEVEIEKVQLFQHFEILMEPFRTIAKGKYIAFNWQIYFDPKLWVEIDPVKVNKVLTNLLINAFKFSNLGGKVCVVIRSDKKGQLYISVEDEGIGIKEDELEKVFERFYQAKPGKGSELVEAHGGSGLGLSLSKDLAELMQGQLWVESEYNKGSTFYFKFPYRLVSGQAEMPLEDDFEEVGLINPLEQGNDESEQGKPHVLVVEDNAELSELLKGLLTAKYRVTQAENGAIAWDLLKIAKNKDASAENQFDLILSDQMMPVMDGLSLLNRIKQDSALKLLPFIMLTARAETKLKLSALRIGVNDFLTKPFEEEELVLRIDNLLLNKKVRLAALSETDLPLISATDGESRLILPADLNSPTKEDEAWLERFDSYIRQNLNNSDLKVADLADYCAMSDSTLLRQVKRLAGLSPQKYLQEVRLQQAMMQIEEGDFSNFSNLSQAVGFNDLASFSRSFKVRFGKSPSGFVS